MNVPSGSTALDTFTYVQLDVFTFVRFIHPPVTFTCVLFTPDAVVILYVKLTVLFT